MANNQKLDISELDFDLIKGNLKTFLKNQDQFLDYDFDLFVCVLVKREVTLPMDIFRNLSFFVFI